MRRLALLLALWLFPAAAFSQDQLPRWQLLPFVSGPINYWPIPKDFVRLRQGCAAFYEDTESSVCKSYAARLAILSGKALAQLQDEQSYIEARDTESAYSARMHWKSNIRDMCETARALIKRFPLTLNFVMTSRESFT